MKVGADWIVYYLRARGVCDKVHNTAIGKIVSSILAEMGCPQNPKSVQIKSPVAELMRDEESGYGLAKSGFQYDIPVDKLPELFRQLSEQLSFELE